MGQGDFAILRDGNGFDVLIDGGKTSAGPTVVNYLEQNGITELDVLVASHADSDHIGGLINVLEDPNITVNQVIYNGYPGTTATWNDFVTAAAGDGLSLTTTQFPAEFDWGLMHVYVLNPASGLGNPDTNDACLVLKISFGSTDYLFTGDIDSTIEATVVARQTPVAAEILKVGHHGSEYSSSSAFLAAVSPSDAVISVGDNSYGHPSAGTISRLQTIGATIWRTDISGNITAIGDLSTYFITPDFSSSIQQIFLPLIIRPENLSPTPTSTPNPSVTPVIPTSTPTPTTPPTNNTGNVDITNIFYDGVAGSNEPDEFVEIKNNDSHFIQLQNWTLRDAADHVFTFPAFVMTPGQICRVYTNENHPEWCGFNYGSGTAIWNNSGDTATLRDSSNSLIDEYVYP